MNNLKRQLVNLLSNPVCLKLGGKYFQQTVPIFMCHRFKCEGMGIDGHDISDLWFALDFLRRNKFNLVSVEDVAIAIQNEELLPERSVAFSLDDGYWDQVEAASHVFARFDCPATYFVVTGFINDDLWLWDSRIHFLVESAPTGRLAGLQQLFPTLTLALDDRQQIANAIVFELTAFCHEAIVRKTNSIAKYLEVELPLAAPEKYASTSWGRLNDVVRMGLKVGPHTYSHPLLSRESDQESAHQINASKVELAKHIPGSTNVFCYPVGRTQDFGVREMNDVRKLGFVGAVSAVAAGVDIRDRGQLFCMPRFGFPEKREDFIQYASWMESFKSVIRKR